MSTPDARTLAAWAAHLGSEPEPAQLIARLRSGSLPEAFHATAVEAPERPALEIDGVTRTHGELDAAAGRFAPCLE